MNRQPLNDGRYDSVSEFIAATNAGPANKANQRFVDDLTNDVRTGWYGANCDTGKDVDAKVMTGWQEGRAKVDGFLAKLESIELAPRDLRRRLTKADFGDHLNIGDVYAGRFQTAWTRATRRSSQGPQRVDIVANMICQGDENADVLFWRGAAAVALSDKLEAAGYMVRMVVGFGDIGDDISCRVTVKNYDMPLDLLTASSIIMPGFFRAIGHRWIAAHATYKRHGIGISVGKCRYEKDEVYLSHEIRDEASAKATVEKTIRAIDGRTEAA